MFHYVFTASMLIGGVALAENEGLENINVLAKSDSPIERQDAAARICGFIATAEAKLIAILEEKRSDYDIDDRARLAAKILGELRAVTAVPTLLRKIDIDFPFINHGEPPDEEDRYVCFAALVNIGRPAAEAALDVLASHRPDGKRKELLQKVILKVEGQNIASLIEIAKSKATSEKRKQDLIQAKAEMEELAHRLFDPKKGK